MRPTFAVRLDFARALRDDPSAALCVAEILARPAFVALNRVSGRLRDRWKDHTASTAEAISRYLSETSYDAVSLDSKGTELVASGEVETSLRGRAAGPTALLGCVVCPVANDSGQLVDDVCALAEVLDAGAGFITVEPSYGQALRVALSASRPKEREGLSEQRQRGRRARNWKSDQLAAKISTVEWGTFLGKGHLAQVDLDQIRASGAFARVVSLSSSRAYLQVTVNPLDDLSGELERQLPRAREVLQPLLMDLSDVDLE